MAAVVAVALTPLVRRLALRVGAVDLPTGRHVHRASTPRLGGVAIFLAVISPFVTLFFVASAVASAVRVHASLVLGVIGGGLAMVMLGVADDIRGVRALHKLYAQAAVAILAFACGFRIEAIQLPLLGTLEMGVFALPVTVFWIVGIINAVNLIDGLDGLAAGIVFFAALTNFIVAWVSGSVLVAAFMASVLGAVLGFLLFNFNPARIFMGDSGSYFLGFLLATSSLIGTSQKASTTVALLAPIIALGIPIFDTFFAIIRRFLERKPLFSPDRGHLHHRLLEMGITHRRAVLILYGVGVLFTVCSIAVSLGRNWQVGIAILGASVVGIGLVRFAGVLQLAHIRNRQKARLRALDVEAFRRDLPGSLIGMRSARTQEEVFVVLGKFAASTAMARLELLEVEDREERTVESWEPPAAAAVDRGGLVSARYGLGDPRLSRTVIKFSWPSDETDVSPQADILLQLLADAAETALAGALGPERAGAVDSEDRSMTPTPLPAASAAGVASSFRRG